jgi:hypothetical protein
LFLVYPILNSLSGLFKVVLSEMKRYDRLNYSSRIER